MATRARSARARLGISRENIIGLALRAIRQTKFPNLSDREFCELVTIKTDLTIDKNTLSKIERGVRCVYDYEILEFCKILEVTPNELIYYKL